MFVDLCKMPRDVPGELESSGQAGESFVQEKDCWYTEEYVRGPEQ
jgi:hypothetical protein